MFTSLRDLFLLVYCVVYTRVITVLNLQLKPDALIHWHCTR